MPNEKLTHIDAAGHARMVDVGDKPISAREAIAEGFITLAATTLQAIADGSNPKGEVFGTARLAGIMAAKRCGDLIPLCHPLSLESVNVTFELPASGSVGTQRVRIEAVARITAKTGVEMEALTAVSVAALTIYDMCKAIDKSMIIEGIRLVQKTKRRIE